MYKYLFVICLLAVFSLTAAAQNPGTSPATVKNKKDTLIATKHDTVVAGSAVPKKKEKVYHPDSLHDPHKAFMHSLIIPGWGQVYNHQWWKVPIVYGGLGGFALAIAFNASNYQLFLQLSKYRYNGVVPVPGDKYYAEDKIYRVYNDPQIYSANDYYRRTRDLCILGFVAVWGIQAIDAYVDAKFIHSYTVDNNLSFRVEPGLINQPAYAANFYNSYIPGLKITFTLR
jgi:uncharacterized protein DUF5683